MATITNVRLLGGAELAALLGVSRGRIGQLSLKPWFPEPIARLKLGGIWELADIQRMAAETGRTLNYEALNALSGTVSYPGEGEGDGDGEGDGIGDGEGDGIGDGEGGTSPRPGQ